MPIRVYAAVMGLAELLLILFVLLLFFGAGRLPALGAGLGRAVRGFKNAVGNAVPARPPAPAEKKGLPPGEP